MAPSFAQLLLLSVGALATQSHCLAASACRDISLAIPGRVEMPISIRYLAEVNSYWSLALREIKPACVVFPNSAEDVATAVTILSTYPSVNFTVKSGGHDPNSGHASVNRGVLISMAELTGATYDSETGLAKVLPGGEWNDVISDLSEYGVTVAGGRLGIVGVGGLLLQGGISFLSAQYGLAADSVVGWNTVLPNGTIAYINATTRPDLAVAMRGSGSQFGIVTEFTIQAHPIGQVWGGARIYGADQFDALYQALHNFVPGNADDPKAAIIFARSEGSGAITPLIFYFYDGAEVPADSPLAEFLAIKPLVDLTSTQSYPALLRANGELGSATSSRMSFRTYTIPYVKGHPEMYTEIADMWSNITAPHLSTSLPGLSQCSIDFQPLPAIIGAESQRRGGNAMGISGDDIDRLILELQCGWAGQQDDEVIYSMSRAMTDWLEARVPVWLANESQSNPYLPLLMNDAMGDQNVTGRYRDYAIFKALQSEMDPDGVFRNRVGGYKY
ncbi:hypothetical protein B0I35DRAFT_451019 [Stachybotrys elegans]|uniref:FAD-binding PCMH-type domain-containing protein n=1 Tax=Stachybotrys elegans TaxID=80388 RepID=A0A8K0SRQ0_9HYPO|nr:hypothetical protein B0I35DRAFT_451019 [Stachybotrys elegans]